MVEKGFRLVTVSSDARLIAAGAQTVMGIMRTGPKKESRVSESY
jgi:4-hydroxy-2-oxoheptanedioate aldolase